MAHFEPKPLPTDAGVSLKPEHFPEVIGSDVPGLWFETHPENYFIAGGVRLRDLQVIADHYPLSLHGVSASLAGPAHIPESHLSSLAKLCELVNPASVSEHVAWSVFDDQYLANLLPAPRTSDVLERLVDNIDRIQTAIGRKILIENPAHYLRFRHEFEEPEFIQEAVTRSGCGWLLDVNNLYISQINIGLDVEAYLDNIDLTRVGEIHVAGHRSDENDDKLLIDSHDGPVAAEVWSLFDKVIERVGPKPVLVEWDAELPSFDGLLAQRSIASRKLQAWHNKHVA